MPTGVKSTPVTALGARLRELREAKGLQQDRLAKLVDTQANRISDWELGGHTPSLPSLQKLAWAFGITVSGLLEGIM